MLPQLPAPVKTGIQKRNVTTPNTTVQKSRVKLYVGGLRPNHTEGQLRRHFAQYGTVTDFHIVRDPKTDESKCFGFVTFQEETHATRALVDCPHFIEGGPVYVKASIIKTKAEKEKMAVSSAAIDMNEKLEGTDEGSGIGGGQEVDKLRLFVGSLSPSTTQQALKEHFSHYGNVTRVDVILERESGKPRGIAFVSMSTPQEVEAILEARPHQLSGESIIVRPAYLRAPGEARASKVVKNGCQSTVLDLSLQRSIRIRHRGRSVYPRVGMPNNLEARTGSVRISRSSCRNSFYS
uniref:Heterogeneous ribonuclear particle protein heterogeneous nuclear ribonucleoprotein n=1 Tax=Echinococcus granulosus TaxID=6210 RepID=U6FT59_ECHGR|nr:heterogeneous ribonuclear particle protein; heterogeneous nuclear ribonucleoprotein [Echinococcus granulosus]